MQTMDLQKTGLGLGIRPAIVVVDMINGFTDPACDLGSDCPQVIKTNKALLDGFREKTLPVYFTTVIYHTPDQARVFREKVPALNVLEPGCHWVELDPALARQEHEPLLEKCWASAFFATDLIDRLRRQQVDSLVVTGLTTSGCVRATAVDGLQHDFRVVIPEDAVADRNLRAHEANLFDFNAKYGDVVSSSNVLDHLSSLG